jgi:hypothetical protein
MFGLSLIRAGKSTAGLFVIDFNPCSIISHRHDVGKYLPL